MTAKERLAAKVAELSEREAEEVLGLLGLDEPEEWPDFPPASPKIMESARRAMADADAGRVYSSDEARKRLGL